MGGFGLKEGEIAVVSGQPFFRAPLCSMAHFSCCQNWRSTSYTYIMIRAVFPFMKGEGLRGTKEFFTLQMGKGNLLEGLVWLLIIPTELLKEKMCLFKRQKLLFHCIKYVFQLLRHVILRGK